MVVMRADIKGFPNYMISTDGNVFNKETQENVELIYNKMDNHIMVNITNGEYYRLFYVHKLVALYFLPNRRHYQTIVHLDGNPANNSVQNLQWVKG